MAAIRDISRLNKNAELACRLFLSECEKEGLSVLITETLRTAERQNELYAQGRTKPGKIVTWTKNSRHMSGNAWDICKNKKGEEYSDTSFFLACGKIAKRLGITWGGDFKNKDMPHFEVDNSWEVTNLEEFAKLREDVENLKKDKKVFRYTVDIPEYARGVVQKLLDSGILAGKSDDNLDLSEDLVRMLVILDRCGVFGNI